VRFDAPLVDGNGTTTAEEHPAPGRTKSQKLLEKLLKTRTILIRRRSPRRWQAGLPETSSCSNPRPGEADHRW